SPIITALIIIITTASPVAVRRGGAPFILALLADCKCANLFAFSGGVSLRVADATRKKAPQTPSAKTLIIGHNYNYYKFYCIYFEQNVSNHSGAPLLAGSSEGRTCWGHPSPSSGLMCANFIAFFDFYNRLYWLY